MRAGDIVMFNGTVDKGDDILRMRVVEMRGDRVLVEALVDMALLPTAVYPVDSLHVVQANKTEEE